MIKKRVFRSGDSAAGAGAANDCAARKFAAKYAAGRERTRRLRSRGLSALSLTGLTLGGVLLPASLVRAQTWTGSGGNTNWSTAGNWQNGVVADSSTASAILSGNTTANLILLDRDITLASLVFQPATNGTARAFTITEIGADGQPHDNALNIGAGGIANNTSLTQTINAVVALRANTTFSSIAGGTLSFLGTAANRYNEVRLNGYTLTVTGAGNTAIASAINGAGALVKTGSGTMRLTGNNTYSGGTTINGGYLFVGDASHSSSLGTGNVINNGGSLNFYNSSSAGGAAITNNNSSFIYFYNSSRAGSTAITNDFGSLYFYNSSSAGSASIKNNNELTFDAYSSAGSATITNNSGGRLYFNHLSSAGSATITNNGGLTFYGSLTTGEGASSAGSATITNNGGLAFSDSSSAGSAAITNNGTLAFYGSSMIRERSSSAGSAIITNNSGGRLSFNNFSSAGSAAITNNSGLDFNDSSSAGSAAITNNSGGTIAFNQTATAGSAVLVNNGVGYFNSSSTAGNATITNNTFLNFQHSSTADNAAIQNDGVIFVNQHVGGLALGSLSGAGGVLLGGNTLTVGGLNTSPAIGGIISGTGGLVKTGTGTLTLSGYNTYTGKTTVDGGSLYLDAAPYGAGDYGATLSTFSAGLQINAGANVTAVQSFQIPVGVPVTLGDSANGKTASLTLLGNTQHLLHTITLGNGAAIDGGFGTPLLILNSTINAGASDPSSGPASVTVNPNALASISVPVGIQGAVRYDVGEGARLNLSGGTSDWYSNGTLTKTGGGTLSMSGTNTYSGTTTVSAGTLAVTGNLLSTGAVTVADSATLSGTGSVGNIVANSGAILAPGIGGIGTLSATSLLWNGGSVLDFDLGANGLSDMLVLRGDNNAATLDFAFAGTGGFVFRFSDATTSGLSASQVVGQSYKLVRLSGGASTNFSAFAPQMRAKAGNGINNIDGTFSVRNDGSGDYLAFSATTFQPVPAPPAAVSLLIGSAVGLAGNALRTWRRKKSPTRH